MNEWILIKEVDYALLASLYPKYATRVVEDWFSKKINADEESRLEHNEKKMK